MKDQECSAIRVFLHFYFYGEDDYTIGPNQYPSPALLSPPSASYLGYFKRKHEDKTSHPLPSDVYLNFIHSNFQMPDFILDKKAAVHLKFYNTAQENTYSKRKQGS